MLPSPTGWRCRGWSEGHERWCRPAAEMGRADFYESPSAAREGGAPAFGTSGIKKSEESPSRGVIYSEESPARRGGGSRTGLSPLVAQRAALRNEDLSTAGPASSKANSGVYLFMTSSVILTAAAAERADGAGSEQGLLIGGGGGGVPPPHGATPPHRRGDGCGPDFRPPPGAGWAPVAVGSGVKFSGCRLIPGVSWDPTLLCAAHPVGLIKDPSPSERGLGGGRI